MAVKCTMSDPRGASRGGRGESFWVGGGGGHLAEAAASAASMQFTAVYEDMLHICIAKH